MLGFDIGGTKCAVILGEEKDGGIVILDKRKIETDHSVSAYEMIDRMCTSCNFTSKPDRDFDSIYK